MATTGKKIEKTDKVIEVPVSTVEITGFANPPVVAVDVNLVEAETPFIAEAVPPPAIIANDQVMTGDKSAIVDAITVVPATAAKGIAIVSNKLSNQGM